MKKETHAAKYRSICNIKLGEHNLVGSAVYVIRRAADMMILFEFGMGFV